MSDASEDQETRGPAAGEVPNEEEVAREFRPADDRPAKEQLGEDEDVAYTGEPVETEDGVVLPQQMVVGEDRVVGGGEFPNDDEDADRPQPDAT